MSRKKLNKTFTIEEATIKIIENFMQKNNFSSYSVAFKRIVIEWSIIKENNIKTDEIVAKVLKELTKNKINYSSEQSEENNKHNNIIKDIFADMPE